MKHDKEITEYFNGRGWTVIRIWECELSKKSTSPKVKDLIAELTKASQSLT